jgi:hypothetical protein
MVSKAGALPLSEAVTFGAGDGAVDPTGVLASVVLEEVVPASCQAGMVGRPVNMGMGDAGAIGIVALRLRSSAFSDFSSC